MTSHWDFSASSPATMAMGVWCAGIPTGWCWAIRCWSLSLDTKRNAGPATGNSPHRPCLQHRPGCGPCWFAWWSSCWNRILRHHRGGGPHHLLPRQRNRRPAPSGVRWFRLYLGDDRASSVVMGSAEHTGRHRLWRLPVAEPMHFGQSLRRNWLRPKLDHGFAVSSKRPRANCAACSDCPTGTGYATDRRYGLMRGHRDCPALWQSTGRFALRLMAPATSDLSWTIVVPRIPR